MDDRVSDALARSQRLVILGDPGAGKTITLKHIALMLASGQGGERLGWPRLSCRCGFGWPTSPKS